MGNNDVFAVIADKTRRGILTVLKDGERPVGDLVDELGVSQPTVSKHLKILREAGMVSMEAQGQRRLYAVRPGPLAEAAQWIHEVAGDAAREATAPLPTAAEPVVTTDAVVVGEPDAGAVAPEAVVATVPASPTVPGSEAAPELDVVLAPVDADREPSGPELSGPERSGPELSDLDLPGPELPVSELPGPTPSASPAGAALRRPSRGAGARAADILSGLRRRTRRPPR